MKHSKLCVKPTYHLIINTQYSTAQLLSTMTAIFLFYINIILNTIHDVKSLYNSNVGSVLMEYSVPGLGLTFLEHVKKCLFLLFVHSRVVRAAI